MKSLIQVHSDSPLGLHTSLHTCKNDTERQHTHLLALLSRLSPKHKDYYWYVCVGCMCDVRSCVWAQAGRFVEVT